MLEEIVYSNYEEFQNAHLNLVVDLIEKRYKEENKQVQILDLATGGDRENFNLKLSKKLFEIGVNYNLFITDISLSQLSQCHNKLEESLSTNQIKNIKQIIVDGSKLSKKLKKGFFDMIIGRLPYSSMYPDYKKAITESFKILKEQGYSVIQEWQVETINENIKRTDSALRGAKIKSADEIKEKLDSVFVLNKVLVCNHIYKVNYYDKDEAIQNGDFLKDYILIHQKI